MTGPGTLSRLTPGPRVRTAAQVLAVAAVLAFVAWSAWGHVSAIDPGRVRARWLPALLLAEALSALLLIAASGVLLGWRGHLTAPAASGPGLPAGALARTTLVATALSYVLPAGPAASSAYAARRYRRYGVPYAAAAQSQVAVTAATGISLGALSAVGLAVPGALQA